MRTTAPCVESEDAPRWSIGDEPTHKKELLRISDLMTNWREEQEDPPKHSNLFTICRKSSEQRYYWIQSDPDSFYRCGASDDLTFRIATRLARTRLLLSKKIKSSQLEKEFNSLAEQWYNETRMMSFIRQKVVHTAYQKIIGMGRDALPFIFRELANHRGDWLWALEAIVRKENPAAGMTTFRDAVQAWLTWGAQKGYIR